MADEEPDSTLNPEEEVEEDSVDDNLDDKEDSEDDNLDDKEDSQDDNLDDNQSLDDLEFEYGSDAEGKLEGEEGGSDQNVDIDYDEFQYEFLEETKEALNHPPRRLKQKKKEERWLNKRSPFDIPYDPEDWCEKDLQELWTDGPVLDENTGWDPDWADELEWDLVAAESVRGRKPRVAPFYIPYRKPFPVMPRVIPYLRTPLAVLEELDRIEEVLKWVSYIFPNGTTYEGTVWDDLAHGKGVLVAESGMVRYEGEWFQNDPEGHGVVEFDLPDIEPVPGSELEDRMRAEGRIISLDYIPPEDKEWLEKDIEDSVEQFGDIEEIPFYENKRWIEQFGKLPEKGRYRYAGQWKHGRMHGCGVIEVNERTRYGRFYFGKLLEEDPHGCDEKISALHSGIAEVAAAKARMFVNKPDGMVREKKGPYGDPQHAYFYEGEDVWMAPGFINQFYEVPEYWKRYAAEVDTERDMWLNSFYRAPLRLPMPAELEHWWEKDQVPEFILVNKEIDPEVDDPLDPDSEDPVIVHTPTGRTINFVEDEEHGVRLFWQPKVKEGKDVDPDEVAFLPDGYDEFYGIEEEEKEEEGEEEEEEGEEDEDEEEEDEEEEELEEEEEEEKEETFLERVGKACQTVFDRLDNWVEEAKSDSERKVKEMEQKLKILDAEMRLEEEYQEMDLELKEMEEEEMMKEKEAPKVATDEETVPEEKVVAEEAEMKDYDEAEEGDADEGEEGDEDEDEDEEEDEAAASSFGTVRSDDGSSFSKNGPGKSTPKEPPFSALSLGFASCSLISAVSSRLHQSVTSVRKNSFKPTPTSCPIILPRSAEVVCYPPQTLTKNGSLRAVKQETHQHHIRKTSKGGGSSSQLYSLSRILSSSLAQSKARTVNHPRKGCSRSVDDRDLASILCLHNQVNVPEMVHR